MDVGTLRQQVGDLQIQLTGLQAQWDGLHSQLDAMLRTNPARPGVQQKWADVGVQIAQVKGDIAYREARIDQMEGRVIGTTTMDPRLAGILKGPIDPNAVFPAAAALLMVLGLPVSIAWARRLLRAKPQPAPLPADHTMHLASIERAIEAVAIEVERISEGQRFTTKILVERPDRVAPAESAADPESASPSPRMLGAGPMEPVNVPQRERVRQPVITPR
jgi:hypothetical protein